MDSKKNNSYVHNRLSEMLISDKLIHEENTKVIAELNESSQRKDSEITRFKKSLKEATKKNEEDEKKHQSYKALINTLKSDYKACKVDLDKKTSEL